MDTLKSKSNLLKLTLLSYSLTCLTGILVILPFVVTQPAADFFHTHLGYIGFVFSFFMFGMMTFQFINGYLINYLSVRNEIYLCAIIYLICVTALFFIHTIALLIAILIILGFCFGMIATLPNYVIVHSFDGKARSAKLNRLDLFFSVGSLIYPDIAGWMLTKNYSWQSVYFSVLILFVAIVILAAKTTLPNVSKHKTEGQDFSKWTVNIWLIGFAIFLYFMSYVGYTYWISTGLAQAHHMGVAAADFGVSLFWITYAIGCYISSIAVRFIPVHKYIIGSALIALLTFYFIDIATTTVMTYASIAVLGLSCATIYSSSISFGTLLVARPSPRIVSFFITLSGIGTYLGQVYSSWIETHFGIHSIVVTSAILMTAAIVLYTVVSLRERNLLTHHT